MCIYVQTCIFWLKLNLITKNLSFLSFFSVVPIHDLPPELWDKELVQQVPILSPMDQWLQQWPPSVPVTYPYIVPLTANMVHTPLCPSVWYYPNKHLVHFMLQGICNGFRIGFTNAPSALKAARFNSEGAQEHPEVVSDYLLAEISLGRIAGPFPPQAVPQVHISRFGVIPKGQTGKWRLIVDLSHPKGHSVNDGISKPLCSLKYITIDDAIKEIV